MHLSFAIHGPSGPSRRPLPSFRLGSAPQRYHSPVIRRALTEQAARRAVDDSEEQDGRSKGVGNGGDSAQEPASSGKRTRVMSEAQRQAIAAGRRHQGSLSESHKRHLSRAIRQRHALNPEYRFAGRGIPKSCGHCGEKGHTIKTCPILHPDHPANQPKDPAKPRKKRSSGPQMCSVCGLPGHNKATCQLARAEKKASEETEREPADAVPPGSNSAGADHSTEASDSSQRQEATGPSAATPGSSNGKSPGSVGEHRPRLPPPPSVHHLTEANLGRFSVRASLGGPKEAAVVLPLPTSWQQCIDQAVDAVIRAWEDGVDRQVVHLLLPQLNTVEGRGWPGGIRQQCRSALPLIEALLRRLKKHPDLAGRLTPRWLDEPDCVALWRSPRLAAAMFVTADTLHEMQAQRPEPGGKLLLLFINPQWQSEGQVVSDFGFGRTRKQAERFVGTCEEVYVLRRYRVFGDDVRLLRSYPSTWQLHVMDENGKPQLLGIEQEVPTYSDILKRLEALPSSRLRKGWLQRMMSKGSYDEASPWSS
ncbi:hypothetical protein ACKKBF_B02690 [Auxenochlorella protothecoides x Auxenochlorella symbiontica]